MKAVTFSSYGKSDVLEYSEVAIPLLKDGDILLQMKAVVSIMLTSCEEVASTR